ncbi:cytochrome P450 [Nocardia sp. NPDC058499]|uniref:cytochrome P450 n=1 Tax=Nocardia sp. NPDC058499 TaxID=3346530 RepID=UPI0036655731
MASGRWPLIGHAAALARNPLQLLRRLPAQGDLVELHVGSARVVVVCAPELVQEMLTHDRIFDKGGPLYSRLGEVIGSGVGSCPAEHHRRQRRLVQPAFHPSRIQAYATEMQRHTLTAVDNWCDGEAIAVYPAMTAITSRIIARALFATPETIAETDAFAQAMSQMLGSMVVRMLIPPSLDWAPLPGRRRFRDARARMRDISRRIITHYRQVGIQSGDVLSMLLSARDETGQPLSQDQIVDEITTLYLAGAETNAATLSWAMHLMAENPEIQQRLHTEASTVLGTRPATWDDIPKLRYTRQVLDETLRLYPPGWILTRTTTRATTLGGHPMPERTTLAISPYLLHRRGDTFPGPDRFDPDRWADPHLRPAAGSYIPFVGGARQCLGRDFALTHTVLALATISARWALQPLPGRVRRGVGTTLAPNRLQLRLRDRRRLGPKTSIDSQPGAARDDVALAKAGALR